MRKLFTKPSSQPKTGPVPPDQATTITKEDIQTQFAVLKMKDGQIMVQFPTLDAGQTVDIGTAMELCGAGLQTLAQIARKQIPQEKSRIAVVGAMPPEILKPKG
jgi:hypothetical protein